jgi:hypothetical protein
MDMRAYVATGALVAMFGAAACEGDTGLMGTRGDRGEAGAKGDPGAPGDDGDDGAKGDPGAPGEDGEDGAPGVPGAPADVPTCGPVAPSVDGEDVTAAIQDCIDEMGEVGGGTVLLRAGTYVLTNHLRFAAGEHDRVRLRGAGDLTVLDVEEATSAILIGSAEEDITGCGQRDDDEATGDAPIPILAGVSIDGVRIEGNLGAPEDCCPLDGEEFASCTRYDDSALTRNGIAVRCAAGVRITNVTIEDASNAGISADHAQGLLVDGAQIDGPLVACVEATDTERMTVRNVTCNTPGLSGFGLAESTGLTLQRSAVFDAGELFQCDVGEGSWEKPSIVLTDVDNSTIADNFVVGSTGRSIELIASSLNIISQNHISDSEGNGIALDNNEECGSGSNSNLLSGNIISNGGSAPILGACPSIGNAVSTNICSGNSDDHIRVESNCDCNTDDVITVVAGPCTFQPPDPGVR